VDALVGAGAKVRVFDSLADGTLDNLAESLKHIEFIRGDLLSTREELEAALVGVEIVFHLAANASVPRSVQEPNYDFHCNAVGTLNLLQAIRGTSVRMCVVASSGAVYGQPDLFPITEEHPLHPISPYGASKVAAEALCEAFHESYGIPIRIARIFNTYGPRQPRFVMYDFYRKLRANPNHLEILGDGSQVRDYCYVEDTVDALLRLAQLDACGCAAFNISSGRSYTVVEVAQSLISIMGLKHVQITFTGSSWAGDAKRWEVSIEKLTRHTGYLPRYDLERGLTRFVEWFDRHPERVSK
jgi:UDP-glucose 4-epimerase